MSGRSRAGFWVPALVVLASGLYARALRSHEVAAPNGADLGAIPASLAPWEGTDVRFDPRIYQVLSADTTLMRYYRDPGGAGDMWVFVAYFHSQRTGAQIHSPKNCLPGGGWNILARRPVPLEVGGGRAAVNRFLIGRGDERQVVYYWFLTRSGVITDEYALKLDLMRNALLRRPTDAAFIRLSTPLLRSGTEATDALTARFMARLAPALTQALPFPSRVRP